MPTLRKRIKKLSSRSTGRSNLKVHTSLRRHGTTRLLNNRSKFLHLLFSLLVGIEASIWRWFSYESLLIDGSSDIACNQFDYVPFNNSQWIPYLLNNNLYKLFRVPALTFGIYAQHFLSYARITHVDTLRSISVNLHHPS